MLNDTQNGSHKKIDEALHLLSEAAKDKKDELAGLLNNKYRDIKETIAEVAADNIKILKRAQKVAGEKWEDGREQVEKTVEQLDEQVHENPWLYIGGTAVTALLIGYILGSSKK